MAVSPDGNSVYLAAALDGALTVMARDHDPDSPDFGRLEFVETWVDGAPWSGLVGASGVAVSPDGAHVYVASKESDSIMVFMRDPATGQVFFVQRKGDGTDDVPLMALDGARDVVVTPDGYHVYVASQLADAIAELIGIIEKYCS